MQKHLLTTKLADSESQGDYGGGWKLLIVAVERVENRVSAPLSGRHSTGLPSFNETTHHVPVLMFSIATITSFPPVNVMSSDKHTAKAQIEQSRSIHQLVYILFILFPRASPTDF